MAEPRITQTDSTTGLHVCPVCASKLVQPVCWAPAAMESWQVGLRCPDCEWSGRAIATQDEVDEFDVALDDGCRELNRALLAIVSPAFDAVLQNLIDEARART